MIRVVFLFFLFFQHNLSAQQSLPAFGSAFNQDVLASIRITIHPDTFALLMSQENWGNDREFPASFQYQSGATVETVQNIGFRLRGNTSLAAAKKPFKVSFNTYTQGVKWKGLEKLNLNAHHNDPAHFRAKLCWDLIRDADLPGSRTSFIKLYINNEYRGLYTNVEHIDEEFVKLYINGIGRGNLYKCLYPADLKFISYNADAYKLESNGRRNYEQKINDFADDYRDLAELIRVINLSPIDNLTCDLEEIFNVDRYLRYAALDVLLGNWDGYAFNKNNFYLYKNELTGLFEYLPYDLDNTFGIDWFNINWATRDVYNWSPSNEQRPLFERLLQVPAYRNKYSYYMQYYLQNIFTIENITQKITHYMALISDAIEEDNYRTLDYGFSYNDFLNSPNEAFGLHVKAGIIPYTTERINNAFSQVENGALDFAYQGMWTAQNYPIESGGALFAIFDNPFLSPTLTWSEDQINWIDAGPMLNDGLAPDLLADDKIYSTSLPSFPSLDSVFLRIRIDGFSATSYFPCRGQLLYLTKSGLKLYINELQADNINIIANEKGSYEDWIEIWNGEQFPINLKDFYLSENPVRPRKFPMPDTLIQPGAFMLFWAENDAYFARNHTNFALANAGEDLRLYQQTTNALRLVDRINYPAQGNNVAYGRAADGDSLWIVFNAPTPNASNQTTALDAIQTASPNYIFPNPATDIVYFSYMADVIRLYDVSGRLISTNVRSNQLSLADINAGIYFLLIDGVGYKLLITK